MDKVRVQWALDNAIAAVGRAEYNRLCQGLTAHQIAANVARALGQLRAMASGAMPEYDEWVSLLYLLWYQSKHINLAYRMIDVMAKGRKANDPTLTKSGVLNVVDFGCGAFAMQFGVGLAAASALNRGEQIESIRISAIDSSAPMIRLGQNMWNHFRSAVDGLGNGNQWLRCLRHVSDSIVVNVITDNSIEKATAGLRRHPSEECWLSAIHAVYQSNVSDVGQWLKALCDRVDPDTGFLTTFNRKIHLAHIASPFSHETYHRRYLGIGGGLTGNLPSVTALRQAMFQSLELSGALSTRAIDTQLVRNYLPRPVNWEPSDVGYLIYSKRR